MVQLHGGSRRGIRWGEDYTELVGKLTRRYWAEEAVQPKKQHHARAFAGNEQRAHNRLHFELKAQQRGRLISSSYIGLSGCAACFQLVSQRLASVVGIMKSPSSFETGAELAGP